MLACYLALALMAGALIARATPFGLTFNSGDSIYYVEGARSIAAGQGYSASIPPEPKAPVVHFPPMYAIAIASVESVIREPYAAARWVSILCFAGSTLLLCTIVRSATGGNFWAGLTTGLMFTVNPNLIGLFSNALSETVFIVFTLAGQAALVEYIVKNRRVWLMVSAICLGLTTATRYSGVVWECAGALTVLLCAQGEIFTRLGKAALFGGISIIPGTAVVIRNRMLAGTVTGRELEIHSVSAGHLQNGMETVASWFLPWRFAHWPEGVAVTLALAMLVFHAAMTVRHSGEQRFGRAFVFWISTSVFAFLYYVHLLLAISFLNYDTPMDDRILAPIEVCAIACLGGWLALKRTRFSTTARAAVCAFIIVLSIGRSYTVIEKCRLYSGGYRGPLWRSSTLVTTLQLLPQDTVMYSNKPEAIYLATDRPARSIPDKIDAMSHHVNERATAAFTDMKHELQSKNGLIVYFAPVSTDLAYVGGVPLARLHEYSEPELKAILSLDKVAAADGADILKPSAH